MAVDVIAVHVVKANRPLDTHLLGLLQWEHPKRGGANG
jgi:hypothetical protein